MCGGRSPQCQAFESRLRLLPQQAESHRFAPDRIAHMGGGDEPHALRCPSGRLARTHCSAMARPATAGLLDIHINLPATVSSGFAAVLALITTRMPVIEARCRYH